jgi:predicted transposase YdaD
MFGLNELRKTRYYQEVREEATLELIRRLLQRRLGAMNPELQEPVNLLSVAQLENLAEALLDFSNEADLVTWLNENSNQLD